MLSTFAQDIWNFFSHLLGSLASAIGGFIQGAVNGIGSIIFGGLKWLAGVISSLFQALGNLLAKVFSVIDYVVQGIVSFFSHVFTLIGLVFQLLVSVFHVLFSFADGLLTTVAGLTYDNSSPALPTDVSNAFSQMQPIFKLLQLDTLAYVLHFAVWFFTAWVVVKMLGNFGMLGGDD